MAEQVQVVVPIRKVGEQYQGAVLVNGVFSHAMFAGSPGEIIKSALALWDGDAYTAEDVITATFGVTRAKPA